MAFNGDINFKGISSKAYPLIVVSPPSIIHSEVLTEEYTIPGKNGTLYGVNPYRGSAQIVVTFALVAQPGLVQNVSKYTRNGKACSWTGSPATRASHGKSTMI